MSFKPLPLLQCPGSANSARSKIGRSPEPSSRTSSPFPHSSRTSSPFPHSSRTSSPFPHADRCVAWELCEVVTEKDQKIPSAGDRRDGAIYQGTALDDCMLEFEAAEAFMATMRAKLQLSTTEMAADREKLRRGCWKRALEHCQAAEARWMQAETCAQHVEQKLRTRRFGSRTTKKVTPSQRSSNLPDRIVQAQTLASKRVSQFRTQVFRDSFLESDDHT